MEAILTRCGYRCDLCRAYRHHPENNPATRQKMSDGWHRYFGFRIPPDRIVCDGCLSDNPDLLDKACPVRPCVIKKGLENCSQCNDYICGKLKKRLVAVEEIKNRINADIPEEDYLCFIQPYENRKRLEAMRKSGG